MTTAWWIALLAFVLLLIFPGYFIFLRIQRPHSKRLYGQQIQLNKKTGIGGTSITAPTEGSGTPVTSRGTKEWLGEYFWSILLVIVGAAILFWGLIGSVWNPHPADVGSWGWGHLIPFLAFCGVLYVLIAIHATGATQKTLLGALVGAMLLVVIAFPLLGWITSPSTSGTSNAELRVCPNVNAESASACVITSDWSSWIQFANGSQDDGKQLCYFPSTVQIERQDVNKVTQWRFKINSGTQPLRYKLFSADFNCSGFLG